MFQTGLQVWPFCCYTQKAFDAFEGTKLFNLLLTSSTQSVQKIEKKNKINKLLVFQTGLQVWPFCCYTQKASSAFEGTKLFSLLLTSSTQSVLKKKEKKKKKINKSLMFQTGLQVWTFCCYTQKASSAFEGTKLFSLLLTGTTGTE